MSKKRCVGCMQVVEDSLVSPGIGTICERCNCDLAKIPLRYSRERECAHCGGKTNFIGAFSFRKMPLPRPMCFYFDCPNPACSKQRMHIVVIEPVVLRGGKDM